MSSSAITNYKGEKITPMTGTDNVFNKQNGEALDVNQQQIWDYISYLKNTKDIVIYTSLDELNMSPPNTSLNGIARNMAPKSMALIQISSNMSNGLSSVLPRDSGVLVIFKVSINQVTMLMLTSIGAYYRFVEQNTTSYFNRWILLTPSKNNQFATYNSVVNPTWNGIDASKIYLKQMDTIAVLSGSIELTQDLGGGQSLQIVRGLPIPVQPPRTFTVTVPYQITNSNTIFISIEFNSIGTITIKNNSTTIPHYRICFNLVGMNLARGVQHEGQEPGEVRRCPARPGEVRRCPAVSGCVRRGQASPGLA